MSPRPVNETPNTVYGKPGQVKVRRWCVDLACLSSGSCYVKKGMGVFSIKCVEGKVD